MEVAVFILAVFVIILIITALKNKKIEEEAFIEAEEEVLVKYSYNSKYQIMTNAEKIFFDKLLNALGNDHYIVPQAHLSTFIDHKIKGQNWRGAFSVINGKSVDFLIVERSSQKPIVAIELDDYTHGRYDRIKRDAVVTEILNRAGIPLQRYANNGQIPTFNAILANTENPEDPIN